MSDNEDLLNDDLGDQSLADYNLGNDEEEQLLADDYEGGAPQNVPSSVGYETTEMVPPEYPGHVMEYNQLTQPIPYQPVAESECVVPNITVEVPNPPEHSTYAPYEPPAYETDHAVVPPPIPAAPLESPQIVPSEVNVSIPTDSDMGGRERFVSERPAGAQRLPQVRDIPDSLDKVLVPRGGFQGRGRTSWRNPQFNARYGHPYRRNNMHRGNFNQRQSFPPPRRPNPPQMRPEIRPEIRPELRPEMHPDIRPEIRPDIPPEARPDIRPDMPEIRPNIRPEIHPDIRPEIFPEMRPEIRMEPLPPPLLPPQMPDMPQDRPMMPDVQFRPPLDNRPFPNFPPRFPNQQFRMEDPRGPRPNFERPMFQYRPQFNPRPFGPRDMPPIPQVTIRQNLPGPPMPGPKIGVPMGREPEVRMLPVQLPPNLPPTGLAGKKVLINPHFKGNFQPPVEGLPVYIPTRIRKTPPLSPTLEGKFGPIKDIDDAAERFIAEQRNALARAAGRKFARRSPQRHVDNMTIEIENDFAPVRRRSDDDDLLRRQEEFINANRAGLRRRMRSPSPARRSASPARRSPPRRRHEHAAHPPDNNTTPAAQLPPNQHRGPHDEDSEYRRRLREQENLRERVLRAKEVRRRKNAVALQKQIQERERDRQEPKPDDTKETSDKPTSTEQDNKPDTTRKSPEHTENTEKADKDVEKSRERSPVRKEEPVVNSTCENLTPPREKMPVKSELEERALTPPLPPATPAVTPAAPASRPDSDDDLHLILDDIDDILSDDDDTGRFKQKQDKAESTPTPAKPKQTDLRSKLPARSSQPKPARQKIVFHQHNEEKKKKEKSPARRAVVTSSTKTEDAENIDKKTAKQTKPKPDTPAVAKSRQRITFDNKEPEKPKDDDKNQAKSFANRRVILQRKIAQPKEKSVFSRIEVKTDPSKPNPGIFSRAVRTAIGTEKNRIVIKKQDEPQIEYESESDLDEEKLLNDELGNTAVVTNLPHGMTDTRLKTLAGNDVQNLSLDKEERSAKITFKTTVAAESFKKKFNNKMVAASRLTVTLR